MKACNLLWPAVSSVKDFSIFIKVATVPFAAVEVLLYSVMAGLTTRFSRPFTYSFVTVGPCSFMASSSADNACICSTIRQINL